MYARARAHVRLKKKDLHISFVPCYDLLVLFTEENLRKHKVFNSDICSSV